MRVPGAAARKGDANGKYAGDVAFVGDFVSARANVPRASRVRRHNRGDLPCIANRVVPVDHDGGVHDHGQTSLGRFQNVAVPVGDEHGEDMDDAGGGDVRGAPENRGGRGDRAAGCGDQVEHLVGGHENRTDTNPCHGIRTRGVDVVRQRVVTVRKGYP